MTRNDRSRRGNRDHHRGDGEALRASRGAGAGMDGSGKLGGVNAENKVKIEKVGGIKAIMKGMGRHGEDAGVQQEGCAAL